LKKERNFHTYRGYEIIRQENILLTPSMEDYLEMIYRTCKNNGYVRITSLAEQLNVQAPSATKTVQKLTEMGYLIYEKYGIIQLTKKGEEIGCFLLRRHQIVETFLKNIGVESELLKQTEMIEHHLTQDTIENINLLNTFFIEHPEILDKFLEYKQIEREKYDDMI
jgi:DtxR family Mn-dependent transcriptional regulator